MMTVPPVLHSHPFVCGLLIRLLLAWLLPLLLDGGKIIPGVAYTDIDYHIYTDAAQHIQQGNSPYDRHTYRYTPFLALFLSLMPFREAGRFLFCLADAVCGRIILQLREKDREDDDDIYGVWWWMYNPLAINICTRGSAESLMVLLPVLVTLQLMQHQQQHQQQEKSLLTAVLAGLVHGMAIHSKLYPLIYTLSFMVYFAVGNQSSSQQKQQQLTVMKFVVTWSRRLLKPCPLLFLLSTVVSFVGLTYASVYWFGEEALQEGLLYHFSRIDHRHNYSIYWYGMYLSLARQAAEAEAEFGSEMRTNGGGVYWLLGQGVMGKYVLFMLPQAVLLLYTSLFMAPKHLGLTLYVQTHVFVTLNKVITAQYFTWYLCLLPLCSDVLRLTKPVVWALVWLGLSIATWLGSAYCLEMLGLSVYRYVWIGSIQYFCANIHLLKTLIESYTRKQTVATPSIKDD